jgi:hypothetical protein
LDDGFDYAARVRLAAMSVDGGAGAMRCDSVCSASGLRVEFVGLGRGTSLTPPATALSPRLAVSFRKLRRR